MNDRFFVVCYNKEEFNFFVKRKIEECWKSGQTSVSMSNFVYADSVDKLRGHRNPRGWFYGRWMDRSDIEHIIMTLMVAQDSPHKVLASLLTLIREIQNP